MKKIDSIKTLNNYGNIIDIMSLIRSNIVKIKLPKYIHFNNFIKLQIPQNENYLKLFGFTVNLIENEMKIDDIKMLYESEKNGNINDYNYFYEKLKIHLLYINDWIKENKEYTYILDDIRDYTYFENDFEYWNITNMVRKYNLSGREIFNCLVKDNLPLMNNMGILSYDREQDKKDIIYEDFNKHSDGRYSCFDWYNGIGVKNNFPVDIYNDDTPFLLNMRRFNDRNFINGYNKILNLISKTKTTTCEFTLYYPKITEYSFTEKENKLTRDFIESRENMEYEKYIIDKTPKELQYFSNSRKNRLFHEKPVWEYMMKEYYEKYIEQNKEKLNLNLYFNLKLNYHALNEKHYHNKRDFTIDDFSIEPNSKIGLCDLSIVNILMFGSKKVSYNMLDYLLSLVRYKFVDYDDCVDNYRIQWYMSTGDKRNDILFVDDDNFINSMKFAKTTYEKRHVAKIMIQLMNEIPPELLNHHNYEMIVSYFVKNDLSSQIFESYICEEEHRIKSIITN
jgi:Mor family transcriptional regulator